MVNVLFVCLGNICRSPMAEAIFRKMIVDEQLDGRVVVDSAGTSNWHIGKPPHEGTVLKLKENNISTEGMYCRQLEKADFEQFDYIVGMDESNIENIREMLGQPSHPKIFRLLDLTEAKKDVPDPYFTGDFQETYELVTEGCKRLVEKIKKEQQLS